jgi:hypothetical protein
MTPASGSVALALLASVLWSTSARAEHWVCAMPNKLEPSQTIIFDFEVAGGELVEKVTGMELRFQMLRNDDQMIAAVRVVTALPTKVAEIVAIDKQRGPFKIAQVFVGEEDLDAGGNCQSPEIGLAPITLSIMKNYPQMSAYIQGDPRGAPLYIFRPGDVPEGQQAESYYNRGIAVCK